MKNIKAIAAHINANKVVYIRRTAIVAASAVGLILTAGLVKTTAATVEEAVELAAEAVEAATK